MEDISNSKPQKRFCDLHKWLVLLSALSVMVIDIGFIYAQGKLFPVIMSEFSSTRAETAVVQSTTLVMFSITGIVNGALIHRVGPRKACVLGACISSLGLIASFFASSTLFLTFSIGLCTGIGSSLMFISGPAAVGKHFVGKTSLMALCVLAAGSGIGGMIYPYVLTYLNDLYGLRGTLLITGGIKLNSVAAALLWSNPAIREKANFTESNISSNDGSVTDNSAANEVKSDHEHNGNSGNNKQTTHILNDIQTTDELFRTYIITYDLQTAKIAHTMSKTPTDNLKMKSENKNIVKSLKDLLRNRCFVLYTIGLSLLNPVLFLFVILTVDIFSDNGFSDSDSSFALLLFNIFSIVGRLLPGVIMQKSNISAMAVPILSSIIGTSGLVVLLSFNSLEVYLTACCVMGLTIGLIVSAVSVTTLTLVGNENLPNAIGAICTANGVGNAAAGPIGGMIRDKTGSYTLVFILAAIVAVIGLIFFVIALCLQTTRSKQNTKRRMSIFYLTKL